MKKVKQFCELSKRELFKLRKKILKRSYKNGTWLLNREGRDLLDNVVCESFDNKGNN